MDFEYDPAKSEQNQRKHGIDFDKAQVLWLDPDRVEIEADTVDEARFLVIGKIQGKLWSAVVTPRGGATRIISVRRARKEERGIYESEDI